MQLLILNFVNASILVMMISFRQWCHIMGIDLIDTTKDFIHNWSVSVMTLIQARLQLHFFILAHDLLLAAKIESIASLLTKTFFKEFSQVIHGIYNIQSTRRKLSNFYSSFCVSRMQLIRSYQCTQCQFLSSHSCGFIVDLGLLQIPPYIINVTHRIMCFSKTKLCCPSVKVSQSVNIISSRLTNRSRIICLHPHQYLLNILFICFTTSQEMTIDS